MHNALYRIGRPRSTADIAGLWQQVFADSEAFLVDYFGRLYNPDLSPCIYTGSRLDASLQLIPFRLCAGGRTLDVLYVYAVMTRPEARGRGMMRSLLDWAHQAAQRRRCAGTLLVAADAQLALAYEHRGYIRAMHLTHARIDSLQGLDDVSFCAGHRMALADVLTQRSRQSGGLIHNKLQFEFALDSLLRDGWQLLTDHADHYAVVNPRSLLVADAVGISVRPHATGQVPMFRALPGTQLGAMADAPLSMVLEL